MGFGIPYHPAGWTFLGTLEPFENQVINERKSALCGTLKISHLGRLMEKGFSNGLAPLAWELVTKVDNHPRKDSESRHGA